ncbi:integrase arm-type DNA-binding domain-containing protein [Bradyrhizobium canariense]|uniref:integrase arm-type DNA-binding domain-containing protein n=1 Tax=Bradyrhizobium canariense TaxID=255045 RepID=UPI0035DE1BA6
MARPLPIGTVTFGYQYTARGETRRWFKLGLYGSLTVAEARTAAKIKAGDVAGDGNPAAEVEIAVRGPPTPFASSTRNGTRSTRQLPGRGNHPGAARPSRASSAGTYCRRSATFRSMT